MLLGSHKYVVLESNPRCNKGEPPVMFCVHCENSSGSSVLGYEVCGGSSYLLLQRWFSGLRSAGL
jgi:hypothetical protein